ncbi:MAG: molybdopterin molybdenumtransferase MoeA [Archangium gephyra]|uniref:Molybdopterin molybdenumtransferase n=1 Tax=Archangium gephyra TaxID=48 RepID=A0A2W5TA17_9BACT|nr:MAG: molybdopterin molybdenumtransferase MoeA [Archangium gephyra]
MSLLPVDDARSRILNRVNPLPPERVQIEDAIGRATVEPVRVRRTLPPWDNSAMDGYAVRTADVSSTPLKVVEKIFAGDVPRRALNMGEVARIMTGARLPPGADAVIMQEQARALDDTHVEFQASAKAGQNVRRRGEDVREGDVLFAAGRELSAADAGALWSQGLVDVAVHRRPRVAIVTSGDELSEVGVIHPDKLVDSNGPVIRALARAAGADAVHLGRADDSLESLHALLAKGLEFDVLIAIAGASVGERDFTREAFTALDVPLDFWRVAMRPGKPLAFGKKNDTLVFNLPGNPVSAMVTFELFVRPVLRALQGLSTVLPALPARASADVKSVPGLRLFVRAATEVRDGAIWATPLQSQSSGALSSAAGATALIDVPTDSLGVKAGDPITLIPVSWLGR